MRCFLLFLLVSILLPGSVNLLFAQDFSNKGKEFYITYPAHVDGTQSNMGIYITSDQAASGVVDVGGVQLNFNIVANTVRRFFLGNTPANDASNGTVYQDQVDGIKPGTAIKVTSNQPVVVYAHIIRAARSGSSLILPTNTWGIEYLVPSYRSNSNQGSIGGRGVINVVAKEPNTVVEITPRANSANNARVAGIPYTITLNNPGDVYQVQFANLADISGTTVKSIATGGSGCKPISVFSATTWSAFECPGSQGGDNLFQQLFPVRSFGKVFLTAPFANRQRDIIRVFVTDPATVVTKTENGVTAPLVAGAAGFAEFTTNNPTKIEADKPIQVVHYMNSQTCDTRNPSGCETGSGNCPFPADPEMVILNPVEQTINNITLFSAHRNWVPPNQSNVNQCYLNIIIPTPAAASFRINGGPPTGNFQAIPGTGYSYLQENISTLAVANPVQQLTADSSFSCIAYGYGNVESYGYNAGTNVKDLYQFLTIRDPYQSVNLPSACQQIANSIFLTVPYPAAKLEWKFYGAFPDVTENNPVPDSTYMREGKTLYRFPLSGKYTFTNPGLQKITVIATNPTSDGCTGEQQIDFEVVIHAKPTATFNVNYTSCISDTARFASTGTVAAGETIVKWDWTFGDGDIAAGNIAAHKYNTQGNYTVSHRTVTSVGCVSDTVTRNVVVNPKPVAAFTLTGPYCKDRAFTLTNTSTAAVGTINRWVWVMGDGQVLDRNNGAPFTYTYTNTGTYTIKLVVTTSTGCPSDTVQQTVTVGLLPQASFTLPEVCTNDALALFTNTSTIADGTIGQATWLWNFGDPNANAGNPNTSTQKDGTHRYSNAQNYDVKLVVISNLGCRDSITQVLTVNGDRPQANFDIVNQGNLCSNLPVQVRNRSSVNFGQVTRIIVYWNYGVNNLDSTQDETPVADKIYTKTYPRFSSPAVRQVQIRLAAYSGTVCVNESSRTIDLYATPDPRLSTIPGICVDANPRLLTQGFDAGNNPGQGIYSGTGINAAGLFDPSISGVGTFSVKYKYVSTPGCTDSTSGSITVWPQPTANFDIGAVTCLNAPITLTDRSSPNANALQTWNWDFGNGQTAVRNNANPFTITYTSLQSYNITLRVTTDSGCNSTPITKPVTVHPLPTVDFDLPQLVCLPEGRASFTNRSTVGGTGGTPITYLWQSGMPGVTSTQTNAVFFYSATGPYSVKLIATSARGCVDSVQKVLSNIIPQSLANWSANPAEVCLGQSIRFTDLSNPLNTTISGWNWNFADGSTSTQQNPTHTFLRAGSFAVSMFYNTALGCPSDTLVRTIVVHPYPVVSAGPDLFLLKGGEVRLLGTATGSSDYTYLWSPDTWLSNPNIPQPISRAEDSITYLLTVTGAGGCSASDDVFVRVLLKPEIPNAFSPNGDGINDVWVIKYLDTYPGATVQVFDRYGKAILRSTGYNKPWDGTIGGVPIPAGVYYYIVEPKNGLKAITGSLTIIR